MKRLSTVFLLLSTVFLASCGYEKVPAGHVGIKVYLLGSSKGVDIEQLGTGRYWIGWNEDLFLFPTFTQNSVWTQDSRPGSETDESFSFQTVQGLTVNADIGISYSVDPSKASVVFQKYRKGINEITDVYLRNMVRDALVEFSGSMETESLYGAGKNALMDAVEKSVRAQVAAIGILVEKIYWIGEIRLPRTVIDSINAKIQATQMTQQRQNEVQQSKAEADKKIEDARGRAESVTLEARAQAEANELLAKSLSPELVRYTAINKWDGKLPSVATGESANFLFQVGK